MTDPKLTPEFEPARSHTSLTPNPDASSVSIALESLPAWLLHDVREQHRALALVECGVGRELVGIQRVMSPGTLTGLDVSEEAIVEGRRRFPSFRFKVDSGEHGRAWDVVVQLDGPTSRARLLPALERLTGMARRAVVAVLPIGALEIDQLPLAVGGTFILSHLTTTAGTQRWAVAVWALAELPAVQQLAVREAFPALARGEAGVAAPQLERMEAELSRVRARLAESVRDGAATRQLLSEKQLELEHLAREVDAMRQHDADLRGELAKIHDSRSWQITRPLRDLTGGARKAQEQARDLLALARKVTTDVARGQARDWLTFARNREVETKRPVARDRTVIAQTGSAAHGALFEPTVFMFALVPFDDVGGGQRSAQLARVLAARGYRVVYVYLYKKWSMTTGGEEESHVDVPLITHLHISQVDEATLLRGASPQSVAIFEAPHPRYEPFFDRAHHIGLRTVFELIDAWDTSLGGDWFSPALMRRFATESEVAVGTARALVRSLEGYGRREVKYLPNAGNEAIFDVTRAWERPSEMDSTRRALVYVGSLYGEWFGWDYVKAAARLAPEANVYLIGDPPRGLELPANVRLLGPRPIDQVPPYLAHADAALIPFIPGKISDAVSPIKVFEYLMMGRAVISTDLPELRGYPNVTIADSVEAFAQACRAVERPSESPESFTMKNTWSARADSLLAAAALPRLSLVVRLGNDPFAAERCVESLALHAREHVTRLVLLCSGDTAGRTETLRRHWPEAQIVVGDAPSLRDAWQLSRSELTTEFVGFLDDGCWLSSRAAFEEALQLFAREATIGVVGHFARFLDADSGQPAAARSVWLNEQRGGAGFRREVAYVTPRAFFSRRRLLERLLASATEEGELEGADLSFRVKAAGFDVAGRALTGLQAHEDEVLPSIRGERFEPFLERWKASRHFFVARRGA